MKKPATPSIKFRKAGIFIKDGDDEERRIGDPIYVLAIGQGIQDTLSYTVLQLQDRDKRWRKAVVRSSLLTARTTEFKEQLSDVYNYRLPSHKYTSLVIDALAAADPKRRIHIMAVPGWHGNRYAHPREIFKPKGDDWECLFVDNPNVLMGEYFCKGTLDEWKNEVAHPCRLSSRLRLAVGIPHACMNDAIDLLLANESRTLAVLSQSDDNLLSRFRRHLRSANFINAGAYARRDKPLTAKQIEAADGFINFAKPEKYRAMLQTDCLRTWFPIGPERDRLVSLLRKRSMMLEGRQADTATRQLSLKPLSRKLPVYWLSLKGLGLTLEDLRVS